MGLSWNSWYNPLDNAASLGKNLGSTVPKFGVGAPTAGGSSVGRITSSPSVRPSVGNPTPTSSGGGPGNNALMDSVINPAQPYSGGLPQTAQPAAADPYARYGGKSAFDALKSGFAGQQSNIFGTAHDAAVNAATGLHGSILDFLESLKQGQGNVDNQAIQNELSRNQGVQGVTGMVGRGIRSGGVMLANKNASDSSASQGIANAYGDLGRRQLSSVGNQYALGQEAVNQSQAALDLQRSQGMRHIDEGKQNSVNGIVADARNQLAALDAAIANASLPDRINIEQEKERVRQDALGQLQQYDQQLAQGAAGVHGTSLDERRAKANQLAQAGQAPADAFNFSTEAPAQFQGTGPFASELPIFTFNRNRRQVA